MFSQAKLKICLTFQVFFNIMQKKIIISFNTFSKLLFPAKSFY